MTFLPGRRLWNRRALTGALRNCVRARRGLHVSSNFGSLAVFRVTAKRPQEAVVGCVPTCHAQLPRPPGRHGTVAQGALKPCTAATRAFNCSNM